MIDRRGWIKTGDQGILDEDGYLKVVGRTSDMINRGGEAICPREIEKMILKHPNVKDVQVIGVRDEEMGEEIMA